MVKPPEDFSLLFLLHGVRRQQERTLVFDNETMILLRACTCGQSHAQPAARELTRKSLVERGESHASCRICASTEAQTLVRGRRSSISPGPEERRISITYR